MSSSAFFIEAAANTVMVLSCAKVGEQAAPSRMMKAAKIPVIRCITSAPAILTGAQSARRNQALVGSGVRQAEAPFRSVLRLTVDQEYRAGKLTALLRQRKGSGPDRLLLRVRRSQHGFAGGRQGGHRHRRLWFRRRRRRFWVEDRILEPECEVAGAA